MKLLFSPRLVSLCVIAFCLAFATPARSEDAGGSPGQQAHAFYAWYLHELNTGGEPITKKKAEIAKYVSARFLKEIARLSKREGGMDADPFICAQDWDKEWEKNIAVRDVGTEGDRARGRVVLNGSEMGSHTLNVQLVREGGAWKIDRVQPK